MANDPAAQTVNKHRQYPLTMRLRHVLSTARPGLIRGIVDDHERVTADNGSIPFDYVAEIEGASWHIEVKGRPHSNEDPHVALSAAAYCRRE